MERIIQRHPADVEGPDIVDPLLTSEEAIIQRGRAEINENSKSKVDVSCNLIPGVGYIEPGTIVEVSDMELGKVRGMATSYSFSGSISKDSFDFSVSFNYEKIL
jgi:hypothetical protein